MRLKRIGRLALAVGAALAITLSAAPPAHADPNPVNGATYHLLNRNAWSQGSSMCLIAFGGGQGTVVQQYGCMQFNDQVWRFIQVNQGQFGVYQIRNENSGRCLLARTGDYWVTQYTCLNFADQFWVAESSTVILPPSGIWLDVIRLRNYASGKCITVQGVNNYSNAFVYPCDDSYLDQQFITNLF